MKKNMGKTDKAIRLLIAAIILILAFAKVISGLTAIILIILAFILVATSIIGTCPLYLPFGLSTLKRK